MKKFIMILIGCLFATSAFAASESVQLSLIPDIAIHGKGTHIKGVSLGIWNENPQTGLALGVVNGSTGASTGISFGFLANYTESYTGAHLACIANYAAGKFKGLQASPFFNYAERLHGVQIGFFNFAGSTERGVQVGLINVMKSNQSWLERLPDEIAPTMILVNWRF